MNCFETGAKRGGDDVGGGDRGAQQGRSISGRCPRYAAPPSIPAGALLYVPYFLKSIVCMDVFRYVCMYVCMDVCMVTTYSRVWIIVQ